MPLVHVIALGFVALFLTRIITRMPTGPLNPRNEFAKQPDIFLIVSRLFIVAVAVTALWLFAAALLS